MELAGAWVAEVRLGKAWLALLAAIAAASAAAMPLPEHVEEAWLLKMA